MKVFLAPDRRLFNPQAMENVQILPGVPVKDRKNNPLFVQDMPWEIRIDNGYPNVIYDEQEKVFHCYYTVFTEDRDTEGTSREERLARDYRPRTDRETSLAYAVSRDGIHWEKPTLGIVEWRGNKENNLLFRYAHGTGVMLDEQEKDSCRRYKMVTKVDAPGHGAHMAVGFSEDGVHWGELIPWPEHNPVADSHNFPFWNEQEKSYMLISRIWKDGVRITTISSSQDFIHWSKPEEIIRGRGYESQIYSMPVFLCHGIYLGLASLIHEGDRLDKNFDCVDCELAWSADGKKFDFVAFDKSLIPRGKGEYPDGDFDCCCIYASPPVMGEEDKVWLYYMGGNGKHTNFRESSLGRAWIEADKFACWSCREKERDCVLTTTTLSLGSSFVEVLADVEDSEKDWKLSASVHSVWTESACEGFSMRECRTEKSGKWIRISWGEQALPDMAGCLRFCFRNLKIWAVRGELEYKGHRLWEGADMENEYE